MSQSPLASFVESCANVAIGYSVSVAANYFVLPAFGMRVTLSDSLMIGAVFTIIALIRTFAVRRLFNRLHQSPLIHRRQADE